MGNYEGTYVLWCVAAAYLHAVGTSRKCYSCPHELPLLVLSRFLIRPCHRNRQGRNTGFSPWCSPRRRDEKYRLMWVGGLPMYTGSVPQPRLIEFGATCTLALLHGSLLAIGNAGDSAAILGRWLDSAALTVTSTQHQPLP